MIRPEHLSPIDYTSSDVLEVHAAMTELVFKLSAVLATSAPEGTWAPTGTSHLDQLTDADDMLDRAYGALREARRAIARADSHARRRLIERTPQEDPMASFMT